MARRNVEMMDRVAVVVGIGHHSRLRRCREREVHAALEAVAARLHARFHHALGDWRLVGEACDVADGISHGCCYAGSAVSME